MAWLSGYSKRIKLTIDNTKIDTTLSNFPITVFFTSTQAEEIFSEFDADSDYMKCAFTTDDGETQLYAEKELFDHSASKAIYHVKVTSIASGADTDIYYYYNNSIADNTTYIGAINTTAGEHVWDSNFKAVYHMVDATTSTVVDSTSNNNDGTKKSANEPIEVAGKVGQSQSYDDDLDYIVLTASNTIMTSDTNFTIETIIKSDGSANNDNRILTLHRGAAAGTAVNLNINADNDLNFGRMNASDAYTTSEMQAILSTATWYYVALSFNSGIWTPYVNETKKSTVSDTFKGFGTFAAYIGDFSTTIDQYTFCGDIDEVRFSNITRNDAWIKATHNSLWDSLLTYSSERKEQLAEAFSIVDSWTSRLNLIEAFSIVDSSVNSGSLAEAEAFSIADSWASRINLAEAFGITDSLIKGVTKNLAETFGIVDSKTTNITKDLAEAFSIVDSWVVRRNLAETLGIIDSYRTNIIWIEEIKVAIGYTEEEKDEIDWTDLDMGHWFKQGWFKGWFRTLDREEVNWTEETKE